MPWLDTSACPIAGSQLTHDLGYNNTIQVIGGGAPSSSGAVGIRVLDIATGTWTVIDAADSVGTVPTVPFGFGQFYSQAPNDQFIYFIDGGETLRLFNTAFAATTKWAATLDPTVGDYGCVVSVAATTIFGGAKREVAVIGGLGDDGNFLTTMQIFENPVTSLAAGPELNVARGGAACVVSQSGDFLFVIGGVTNGNVKLDSIEVLDVSAGWYADSWTLLTQTISPAMSHMRAVVFGDDIWTVGGESANGKVAMHNILAMNGNAVTSISQWTPRSAIELSCTAPVVHLGELYSFGGLDSSDAEIGAWYHLTANDPTVQPSETTSMSTEEPTAEPTVEASANSSQSSVQSGCALHNFGACLSWVKKTADSWWSPLLFAAVGALSMACLCLFVFFVHTKTKRKKQFERVTSEMCEVQEGAKETQTNV